MGRTLYKLSAESAKIEMVGESINALVRLFFCSSNGSSLTEAGIYFMTLMCYLRKVSLDIKIHICYILFGDEKSCIYQTTLLEVFDRESLTDRRVGCRAVQSALLIELEAQIL